MSQLVLVQAAIARRPKTILARGIWLAGLIAAPTVLRVALDPLLNDLTWFELHFPAILVGTLMLGWKLGVLIAAGSGLLMTQLLAGPAFAPDRPPMLAMLIFFVSAGLIIFTSAALISAIDRLQEMHQRELLLNDELRHRAKNGLAMAQALASQAARQARQDPEGFYTDFRSRLHAIAEAHEQLAAGNWLCCMLPDLAASILRSFPTDRITISGARHAIVPEAGLPLGFALRELADNAVKHGALSSPEGRVDLSWRLDDEGDRRRVILRWVESGGPVVRAPSQQGLGSRLLIRQPGLADVRVDYLAEGVRCEIAVEALPNSE